MDWFELAKDITTPTTTTQIKPELRGLLEDLASAITMMDHDVFRHVDKRREEALEAARAVADYYNRHIL